MGRAEEHEVADPAGRGFAVAADKVETGMSEAVTPGEQSTETELSETPDEAVPVDDEYDGPDPEDDPKGDGSDEDQGT